ncbi:MAG: DUF3822 family protein [Bacteroidota bacterium]
MSRAPYHIVEHLSPQLADSLLATCRLSLFVQPSRVYAVLTDQQRQMVACWEYYNEQQLSREMFLRFVLEKEIFLRQPFAERFIYTSASQFALIPKPFFAEEQLIGLGRVLLDDALLEEEIQLSEIGQPESNIMYMVSPGLRHLFEHYFADFELKHICEPALFAAARLSQDHSDFLLVHSMEEQVLVVVVREHQVQLCNAYPIHSLPDMVYFVQLTKSVTQINDPGIPVFVWGEIDAKTAEPTDIWELLPDMEVPPLLEDAVQPHTKAVPYWKYAFLTQSPA